MANTRSPVSSLSSAISILVHAPALRGTLLRTANSPIYHIRDFVNSVQKLLEQCSFSVMLAS
ncbi:HDOD domain-containing protein [Mesorhizobium erdmanii]